MLDAFDEDNSDFSEESEKCLLNDIDWSVTVDLHITSDAPIVNVPRFVSTISSSIPRMSFLEFANLPNCFIAAYNQGNMRRIRQYIERTLTNDCIIRKKFPLWECNGIGVKNIATFPQSLMDSHPDGISILKSIRAYSVDRFKVIKCIIKFSATIVGDTPLLMRSKEYPMVSDFLDPSRYSTAEREAMKQKERSILSLGKLIMATFKVGLSMYYDEVTQTVQMVHQDVKLLSFTDSTFENF